VRFHQTTLEEIEFEEGSFDAILYFDVLHHVVDEETVMEKSFRFLKPGGCLGIVEGAWHPDFKKLEADLIAEMARFGTLENPFSTDYIDDLLKKSGFIDIKRYVGVNGFFTETQLMLPLQAFGGSIANSNNMTARKPGPEGPQYPRCTDFSAKTDVRITLIEGGIDPASRLASCTIELENTGETLLDNNPARIGHITLALRQGIPGSKAFLECGERIPLSETLLPGESLRMNLAFTLPPDAVLENWELDLVAEGLFWFSGRTIPACPLVCV